MTSGWDIGNWMNEVPTNVRCASSKVCRVRVRGETEGTMTWRFIDTAVTHRDKHAHHRTSGTRVTQESGVL